MSSDLLVINADGPETRVAFVEGGQLVELYIERRRDRGIVGNIVKGRVRRVLPGMQAAFVDIGHDKAAFLFVGDIRGAPEDYRSLFADGGDDDGKSNSQGDRVARSAQIQDLVKEGQDVLVQVAKDPIGTKGARLTAYISLPGRNLVFMPTVEHIGISRRIGSDKERKRLRSIVDASRPPGAGFIVRTVAEGVSEKELFADMEFLIKLWNSILKKHETARAPAPLYNDLDLLLRTVRDMMTPNVERLVVDSRSEHERLLKFVGAFMPEFASKIELFDRREPIFDAYGIEAEISRALERKVQLKSGGSLIIDQGEALTAIDVNTGKFVGKKDLEDTITKTNLEASKEVAEQLRLRNLGGMIIVDFIDMESQSSRDKVMRAFEEALKKDKARTNITKISELGLVEMTRKRTRESLQRILTEPCPYCDGKGYVRSKTTVCAEILRRLRRDASNILDTTIVVLAHPDVADLLQNVEREYLQSLEKRLQKRILVQGKKHLHIEQFELKAKSEAGGDGDRGDRGDRERGGRGKQQEPRRKKDEVAAAPPPASDPSDDLPDDPGETEPPVSPPDSAQDA